MAPQGSRPEWIGTQLQVLAISGLERSHSKPFVRVIYKQHSSQLKDCVDDVRAIESSTKPLDLIPERRSGQYYTAVWGSPAQNGGGGNTSCCFELPDHVDRIELQIWNHFATGFDVFLSKTSLSLEQLRSHLDSGQLNNALISTGCMWVPLQLPSRQAKNDLGTLELSAQINVDFIHDDKISKIREQLSQQKRKAEGASAHEADGKDQIGVADPTFAFTKPFLQVEWGLVASTSVRHLFFHNDVERILDFRELVLFGDVERELDNHAFDGDCPLYVDPGHLAAFRLTQFAAQYLAHCVDAIDSRVGGYSTQLRTLTDTAKQLRMRNRVLSKQRRQLEHERDQLSLVIDTYERFRYPDAYTSKNLVDGAYQPHEEAPDEVLLSQKAKTYTQDKLYIEQLPTSNDQAETQATISPLSAKKPAFIMTWEEREQERQREKEATKTQRILDEQRRLQRRLDERASLDQKEMEAAQHRELKALTIQRAFRSWTWRLRGHRFSQLQTIAKRAAVMIQAHVRRWLHVKSFSNLRVVLMREREQRLMAAEDADSTCTNQKVQSNLLVEDEKQSLQAHTVKVNAEKLLLPQAENTFPPPAEDVELLVSAWRKLRVKTLEAAKVRARNGVMDFRAIFRLLDLRRDGVIDRSELRRGMKLQFNIDIDRKLTRGLLALIRGKAGEPSTPLLLSCDQFCKGLDLERCSNRNSSSGDIDKSDDSGVPKTHIAELADEDRIRIQDTSDTRSGVHIDMVQGSLQGITTQEDDINQQLLEVASAAQALRSKLNAAARTHLASTGKLPNSYGYHEFRAALSHVFQAFDTDGSGKLDLKELGDCLTSIGVCVSDKNMVLLRECFCSSAGSRALGAGDDAVTISEFVSFVLANSSTDSVNRPQEELGLLGYRVRSVILSRIESAREHLSSKSDRSVSLDDGLRWVFRFAYPEKKRECSLKEFANVLRSIKELRDISSGQIVRIAACFDLDGDLRVSFDELLAWLRLDSPNPSNAPLQPATPLFNLVVEPIDSHSGFHIMLKDVAVRVDALRDFIKNVAVCVSDSRTSDNECLTGALFDLIDHDHSGKIVCDELARFLSSLPSALIGSSSNSTSISRLLVDLVDSSANGVISREEWLRFSLDRYAPIAEEYSVRTFLRYHIALITSGGDQRLGAAQWLASLPGTVQILGTTANRNTHYSDGLSHCCRIRVSEFRQALRKIIGTGRTDLNTDGVSLVYTAVNAATKALDKDSSGWITTEEFVGWILPTRDLEEIIGLIRRCWGRKLRQSQAPRPDFLGSNFAENLYDQFDSDGNGFLARRELQIGLHSVLALDLSSSEVETLVAAYDTDGDGCWSRHEFIEFAQDLASLDTTKPVVTPTAIATKSNLVNEGIDYLDENADKAMSLTPSDAPSNEDYLVRSSPSAGVSNDAASEAYSSSFQESSPSRSLVAQSRDQAPGVHYDDDFEE